jgi:hypothetical protein
MVAGAVALTKSVLGGLRHEYLRTTVLCDYDVLSGQRRWIMIRMRHLAAVAALCSLPVLCLAQAQGPAAGKPAPPMKPQAKEEKMAATPASRRLAAKSRGDARECLSFPTNREIIICAEKFL